MSGSTIGGLAGGVIGFWIGGPMGAQIGFAAGSMIGGAIDPDVIKGPSLGDMPVQTSSEGVPRPIIFGSPPPFSGNIIQIGPKVFTTKREHQDSGKGGGPVVESQEVYQPYLIRICQGIATVITVWRDGKVVFDRSGKFPIDADGQAFMSRVRFYTGDELQLPDPGFEALVGSGNQPAYRGTAYMAVYDDNLTNTGGRIPNYEFRMASVATVTNSCTDEPGLLFWYKMDDAAAGGTCLETVSGTYGLYSATGVGSGPALSIGGTGSALFNASGGHMVHTNGGTIAPVPDMQGRSEWTVSCWAQPVEQPGGGNGGGSTYKAIVTASNGAFFAGEANWQLLLRNPSSPADHKNLRPFGNYTVSGTFATNPAGEIDLYRTVYVVMTYKDNPAYGIGNGDVTLYAYSVGGVQIAVANNVARTTVPGYYIVVGGGYAFPSSYQFYGYVADVKGYDYAFTADDVLNHYLNAQDDFWENPDAPGTYTDAEGNNFSFCNERAELGTVSLAEVELELARMVNVQPSQFNVTADTDVAVDGFAVMKRMRAAEALSVLGQAYLRCYPEYDLKIVSTPFGGPVVATITEDNCIDTDTDEQTRAQPLDLPRAIDLYFYDADAGAIVPVNAKRTSINVTSEGTIPIQLPMTLDRDYAKQIAEITMKRMWEEQLGSRLIRDLPIYEFAYLTPADPIEFEGRRWRIEKTTAREGALQIECVRDRISNFQSTATANILEPPQTPVPNIKGPTVFVAMNLPALRTEDAGRTGVYAAGTGLTRGWPGYDLFATLDPDADTWTRLTRIQTAATMGRLYADISSVEDSNGFLRDPMYVKLYNNAEVDSATQAQIDAGANAFAINTAGVSDVGQFATALQDSGGIFELTDVVLGQLGTTAANHNDHDTFVLLNNSLRFVDLPADWTGQTVYFKPVTIGTPIENATTYPIDFELPITIVDGGWIE